MNVIKSVIYICDFKCFKLACWSERVLDGSLNKFCIFSFTLCSWQRIGVVLFVLVEIVQKSDCLLYHLRLVITITQCPVQISKRLAQF